MSSHINYTQNTLKTATDKTWRTMEESKEIGFLKIKKEMDDSYNSFSLLWSKKNLSPDEINKYAEKYVELGEKFKKCRDEIKTQTKLTKNLHRKQKDILGKWWILH